VDKARHAGRFMTVAFDCTDQMKKVSPGALHVDGTARPQLLNEEAEPDFYRLLRHYHELTGLPTLLNIGLCLEDEPLACTPDDALRVFKGAALDCLAMGPFLARGPKRADPP